MTDKLYELASDMEANKLVNNPGNWYLVQAAADRLESLQAKLDRVREYCETWPKYETPLKYKILDLLK